MTDTDLITRVAQLILTARMADADRMQRDLDNFQDRQRDALEQPHSEWTVRELEKARKRLDRHLN